ncbi:MAG: hypothetical protein IKO00_00460 [Oscillospiraceae bacterium]|nr:hypothetical protein [Oscillospiraceae bacterium]
MTLAELNGHLDMVTQLHSARLTLQSLQDRILGAQQYDGMPHGHDASRKVENLSILLKEQSDDVDRLERIVARSEKNIRKWISSIPDNRTKVIFNLRFLCGMKWEDMTGYVGMNSVEAVKSVCYRYLNQDQPSE